MIKKLLFYMRSLCVSHGKNTTFHWMNGVIVGVVLIILFMWKPSYVAHLLVMLGIYLLLVHSLNIVLGFGGLVVFCQAMFYGIGAYAYALTRLYDGASVARIDELLWAGGWSFFPGVAAGGMAGAILAWVVGCVCLRFRGDYFIFATMGFQMIFFVILYNWGGFGGGAAGIQGIPRPAIFGVLIREPWHYMLLIGGTLLFIFQLLVRLYMSPFGLALKTMREDERAARAMGIDTNAIALRAMAVSGGIAGVAGAFYASYVTYIDPTSFTLEQSIFLVTILMLGGRGNVHGPLAGTIVMLILPEVIRLVGLPDVMAANLREIVYGCMLVGLMYWRPQGLVRAAKI